MSRSLIRQLEQVKRSVTYDDVVANVTVQSVAEPTVSGSLEEDLNVIRSLTQLTKGTTDWYTDLAQYFDPTTTDSGSAELKDLDMLNLKNNTLDAHTVIVPVVDNNSGNSFSVSGTQDGFLIDLTTLYALPTVRPGLPIFSSTTNSGTYWDEGGSLNVCAINILSASNGQEVSTSGGDVVYGLFYDGADYSGTGTGVDAYVKFYANGIPTGFPYGYETSTTVVSGVYTPPSGDDVNFDFSGGYIPPSGNALSFDFNEEYTTGGIQIVYPRRRVMTNLEEYEWFRTDFVNNWEGDTEISEDIRNLFSYTGAVDGQSSTVGTWTNASGSYPLSSDPANLQLGTDLINTEWGDMNWSGLNYPTIGDDLAEAITALDTQVKLNADAAAGGEIKYVEDVAIDIQKDVIHQLPSSIIYVPDSTTGEEGSNMDVFINGQLLVADTGVNGANADRDYGETTTSGITFRSLVDSPANITYKVKV